MRTDLMSRPELIFGSVEYRATVDYCKVMKGMQQLEMFKKGKPIAFFHFIRLFSSIFSKILSYIIYSRIPFMKQT